MVDCAGSVFPGLLVDSLKFYSSFVESIAFPIASHSFLSKYWCQMVPSVFLSGLSIDENSRKKMDVTAAELVEEKALAYSCL